MMTTRMLRLPSAGNRSVVINLIWGICCFSTDSEGQRAARTGCVLPDPALRYCRFLNAFLRTPLCHTARPVRMSSTSTPSILLW